MKFGVNTLIWGASFEPSHFSLLPGIKAAGFDGIELPIFNPAVFDAAAIRKELETCGLECTAVSILPAGTTLTSSDRAVRQKAQSHIQGCIAAATEAGAQLLAGPLYSPVGCFTGKRRTLDEWSWAVESWRELAPAVSESDLQIAIEPLNRFETYFLNTVADGAAFCDAIDRPEIGLLVDTFHANIEEKNIGAALRRAGRHLKHLHACENDRGAPGTGNVNWPEFFRAVDEIGYDGWITIESFGFNITELSAAASIWRDLAPTPESIAFDGVKFLKAQAR
ncbi:MAG: sugar phosphate isomerase/epimerase family protein [Bryobacteraceae bacterium]